MENRKHIFNLPNTFRNYIPFASIFILTVGLLFYFKENKQSVNEFIESGKNNLVSFYTQNLKPLLFKTDISNEDVFNFALYQNLPIDKKEKKILQIGYDDANKSEFYEIKPADLNENTQNYKKFSEYLKLNKQQQLQLDSILASYKDALYTSVLYNDYNTIAVNSKISLLREAAFADIMSFAQSINSSEFQDAISKSDDYNTADMRKAINEIKEVKGHDLNDFVIFTPDSIFKTEFEIDNKKFNNEMASLNWDLNKIREELKDINFEVKVNPNTIADKNKMSAVNSSIKPDSNYYKAFLTNDFMMNRMKNLPDVEKMRSKIEKLTADLAKIKVEVKTADANKIAFKLKNIIAHDSENTLKLDLNFTDLDSLIEESVNKFGNNDIKDWEEFGFKMDSIANAFEMNFNDSVYTKFDKNKLKEEIKRAKNELIKKKQTNF